MTCKTCGKKIDEIITLFTLPDGSETPERVPVFNDSRIEPGDDWVGTEMTAEDIIRFEIIQCPYCAHTPTDFIKIEGGGIYGLV